MSVSVAGGVLRLSAGANRRLAAPFASTLKPCASANCLKVMRWSLSVCVNPCFAAMARAAAESVAPLLPALLTICARSGAYRCVAVRRLSWRACGGAGRIVELRAGTGKTRRVSCVMPFWSVTCVGVTRATVCTSLDQF